MTFDPIAANLAIELTRLSVQSARPDAPVASDERTRSRRMATARRRVAGSLRSVARWVEPSPAKVCQPS
jgi:hypothetical protein